MKRHVVFGVLIILIMVVVEKSFAQDTTHNVDYYIDQCQNKYKELQRTIEETGRFFREFNGKDQSDQVASMTIKFFYDITCELRDMFYNEGIFLFLYKHIDSKSREVVSGFLDNALTLSLGNIGTNIRSSRYSLEQYKKGPVNYNALQLADLMNRQIESSGRLFGEIKNFYMLENKIAKSKG